MPLFNRNATVNLNKAIVDNNWIHAKSIIQDNKRSCQKWSTSLFQDVASDILPIHQACAAESVPLDFLVTLMYAFPEAIKKTESTFKRIPLHIAVKSRASEEVIRFLVQSYPDGVKRKDSLGRIPLHYAISNSLPINIVRFLIDACPELIAAPDNTGWTPLHVAANMAVSTEIVLMIAQSKPEVMKMKTTHGWTPLKCAEKSNSTYTGTIIATLTAEEKKFESSSIFTNEGEGEQKEESIFHQWRMRNQQVFISDIV